jgi:hypothetical protein
MLWLVELGFRALSEDKRISEVVGWLATDRFEIAVSRLAEAVDAQAVLDDIHFPSEMVLHHLQLLRVKNALKDRFLHPLTVGFADMSYSAQALATSGCFG